MPHQRIAKRVSQLQPTAVNSILAEVNELKQSGRDLVSLMRGEPDLATPAHIVEAANQALAQGRTAYPNNLGDPALRKAVAGSMARSSGVEYSPDTEILISSGATLGVYSALAAVVDPGDVVLVPSPIYDAYLSVIALVGGIAQAIPTTIVDGRFWLDAAAVDSACGVQTRVLLLNTPWNPTGSVLSRDELEGLMKVAERRDLIVISDEIYEAIVYNGAQHLSPAALSDESRGRTIVVNSFSKTYAMTGWRVGYCCGPADLIRAMYLVLQQSSRGPATFVQDAAAAALEGPQDCIAHMLEEYSYRRDLVCDTLKDLKRANVIVPQGGFFAMLDVRELGMASNELRRRLLHDFGIVVVHGAVYGPSAEGTLRVSFASGGKNLKSGLERLRSGLRKIGK